jgi:MFS family permease
MTMSRHGWITKFAALRCFLSGCETYLIAPTAWIYIKSLDQTTFFLALVLTAFNVGAIIAGPISGFFADRFGNPRFIFLCSCITKVFAYMTYSINLSAYFPLFGRFISGISEMGATVLMGQIALLPEKESRGGNFLLAYSAYILGAAVGPGIGSFITFRKTILGWEINEGNSPGIVLTIIWLVFLILAMLLPSDIWIATGARNIERNSTDDETKETLTDCNKKEKHSESGVGAFLCCALGNTKICCLFFLIFCSDAFSSTSTFYVPVLALDHFHLHVIHIKLLFLNCTLFTLMVFTSIYLASHYVEERKLLLIALFLQIIAISFLTYLAFSWNEITDVQWFMLLPYICFGMPYFAYPLGTSILSKMTDPRNATFIQGLTYGVMQSAIVISRVLISFVFTKTSLLLYCFSMVIMWLSGVIWYGTQYRKIAAVYLN